jgi:hypothetical protein
MITAVGFGAVRVDPDLVLRLQRYRQLDRVPPRLHEVARQTAALAEALIAPQGWMWRGPVRHVDSDGSVRVGEFAFNSRVLARTLERAVEAIILLLTVGDALERRAHDLIGEEHLVEGLLLDTAGWAALDAMLKQVRQRLAADARREGRRLTARLAPGFADWGLEQQRELFAAFDGVALPVRLTDAQVMLPRKSLTGLYGMVPA